MAILTKTILITIFWLFVIYSTGTIIILTVVGPSYLLKPRITQYYVGDSSKTVHLKWQSANPVRLKYRPVDTKVSTVEQEEGPRASDEDWEGFFFNESYVSVLDDQPLNFHCNVCAVVTNSGQLLGKGAGHQIDQSDCVFRMNSAPTRGFEKDVGKRTDVRIIGHSNLIKRDFKNFSLVNDLFSTNIDGNSSLVFIPWLYSKEINKTGDASYLVARNLSQRFPDVKFYVSTPEWVTYSEDLFRLETGITRVEARTWVSTGWMTILSAIESCETVNVYGMVEEQHCMKRIDSDVPYHYYASGVNDTKECQYYLKSESSMRSGHKLITEKAVFARWSTRHDLNFFYPKWENITVNSSSKLDTLFLRLYKDEPLRIRERRRKRMLQLRERFKQRYKNKRIKIVYKHSARGGIALHHKKT